MSRRIRRRKHPLDLALHGALLPIFALACCIAEVDMVIAASGNLDTSFDGDGKVLANFGDIEFANAVAQQADGKLLIAGGTNGNFVLARFNTNGTLDTTFGKRGLAITDFGGPEDSARAMVVAPNGRIVLVGRTGSAITGDFAVARYTADGSLDFTFSGDGKLTGTYGGNDANALAVALTPNNGLFIVGGDGNGNFGMAKLTPGGNFDNAFSVDGKLTRDFGGNDFANAVFVLGNGSIIVFGEAAGDFGMVQFDATGLEQTLNGGGVENGAPRTDFFGSEDFPRAAAVQADGKFVVVGQVLIVGGNFIIRTGGVARFNPDGTLDTTFSEDGLRALSFGGTTSDLQAVTVQLDGRIVVAGLVDDGPAQKSGVARLLPSGAVDATFSGDGLLQTSFGSGNASAGAVLAQRADGRIVVAGSVSTFTAGQGLTNADVALARYHAMRCNSRDVTAIGTNGADTLNGKVLVFGDRAAVPLPDVINALGGNDTVNAGGADDHVCGGSGRDVLNGGPGADVLLGEADADTLQAGGGTDVCVGGGIGVPPDTFDSCETINNGRGGLSGEWLTLTQTCGTPGPRPDCVLLGSIHVFNPGTETTAIPSVVLFYLSADETLDEDDVRISSRRVRALRAGAGTDVPLRFKFRSRRDLSGMFVLAVLDATDVIPEVNEENNLVSAPIPPR